MVLNSFALKSHALFIPEELRIGSASGTGCTHFTRDYTNMCCLAESVWTINRNNHFAQFAVYSNPENLNVTVEQIKWLVDEETRGDIDIGLYIEQSDSNSVIWVRGCNK